MALGRQHATIGTVDQVSQVEEIDSFIGDVPPKDVELVATAEDVLGHKCTLPSSSDTGKERWRALGHRAFAHRALSFGGPVSSRAERSDIGRVPHIIPDTRPIDNPLSRATRRTPRRRIISTTSRRWRSRWRGRAGCRLGWCRGLPAASGGLHSTRREWSERLSSVWIGKREPGCLTTTPNPWDRGGRVCADTGSGLGSDRHDKAGGAVGMGLPIVVGETEDTEDRVTSRLGAIDWDFTDRPPAHGIEGVHPYPAKFIGEIPGTLLRTLPIPPDTAVMDPFCGSGTTLVESQRLGIRSVGVDLNPIACLMSRVKTSPMPSAFLQQARAVVDVAEKDVRPRVPDIPNLDHWFKPSVQIALASLVSAIDLSAEVDCRDALRLALSSVVVRVSNQDSDTRYAAVCKRVEGADVFVAFLAACKRLNRALEERSWPLIECQVIEADVLTLRPKDIAWPVGLVITSPPYPNAYEYWLYHKYRMWWLGYDPIAVKRNEIGARAHFFTKNHHTEQDFAKQMMQTFAHIDAVLISGGHACVIVGRSRIHGQTVDNAEIIDSIARGRGFSSVGRFERNIASGRKSFNLSHANIKREEVLVFRKTGD